MDVNDLKGLYADVNARMLTALDHVRHELAGVRSGRASVTILDGVHVEWAWLEDAAQSGGGTVDSGAGADRGAAVRPRSSQPSRR